MQSRGRWLRQVGAILVCLFELVAINATPASGASGPETARFIASQPVTKSTFPVVLESVSVANVPIDNRLSGGRREFLPVWPSVSHGQPVGRSNGFLGKCWFLTSRFVSEANIQFGNQRWRVPVVFNLHPRDFDISPFEFGLSRPWLGEYPCAIADYQILLRYADLLPRNFEGLFSPPTFRISEPAQPFRFIGENVGSYAEYDSEGGDDNSGESNNNSFMLFEKFRLTQNKSGGGPNSLLWGVVVGGLGYLGLIYGLAVLVGGGIGSAPRNQRDGSNDD